MKIAHAIDLVRRDIGDLAQSFLTTANCDGMTLIYDLPPVNVNPDGLLVQTISGATNTVLQPTSAYATWDTTVTYLTGNLVSYSGYYFHAVAGSSAVAPHSDGTSSSYWAPDIAYTLDSIPGTLTMSTPIGDGVTLVASGSAWGMFTDDDLAEIIHDAVYQHCYGQTLTERYRNTQTFITYRDTPKELHTLPHHEQSLMVMLAEINCFWVLATDAATEVNVDTAEGTNIDRVARYNQLMNHIEQLTHWYQLRCNEFNVGMFRCETLETRRVSRTTGRLVPLYRDREFDDHRYAVRKLPQIDRREEDNSGIPSPVWDGNPL